MIASAPDRGPVGEAAAQPVRPSPGDARRRAALRELELDRAAAVVEAAGAVLEHLGLEPLAVAGGDLPHERRVLRVHAGSLGLRAVDVDLHQQASERHVEAEVERVADLRRRPERQLVRPLRARDSAGDADVLGLAVALDRVRAELRDRDREVLVDLEDDRLLRTEPQRRHLGLTGGDHHVLVLGRRRQPEPDVGVRRGRRLEPHAEQLEQRNVELVGNAVDAVDERLGHPREQLDQRDARIGDVVVCPFRTALGNPNARLVDELLEAAVVEHDLWEPAH